ncbi:hypothetical protein SAMN02745163_04109 [Clostridium cavendishii DSM 21758]|uniref:DUF4129 domain-containing protein n=1 Tax=Clostridium cavendishii DSM 21758 TaxID=1121302 RepID=A0A1M6TT88_9CLOT|nr:hypothetical protein [Clostridium cavendishii]SHK60225.1 hypothetical protein SAMN02745163_04109 [Clostridium cavendishii DSM 21758]
MNNKIIFKFLYGIIIALGVYIPYSQIISATIKLEPNENIFFLVALVTLIYVFLDDKNIKNNIILFSPILMFIVGILIFNSSEYLIYIGVPVIQITFLIKTSYTYINRNYFEDNIKKIIYILLLSSILYLVVENEMIRHLGKFYFIFIFFSLILLRRARLYQYKLKDKNIYKKDIIAFLIVLILTIDRIYEVILELIGILLFKLNFVIDKILYVIVYIGQSIYDWFISIFGETHKPNYNLKRQPTGTSEEKKEIAKQSLDPTILKILFILILIFIIYKIVKFTGKKRLKLYDTEGEEEERERLEVSNKKSILKNLQYKFLNYKNENKVIFIFYKVEKAFYKKNIFNKTMTATQMYKVGKNSISSKEELKLVANVYNEVKFSNHNIDARVVENVEKAYEKIKKEI